MMTSEPLPPPRESRVLVAAGWLVVVVLTLHILREGKDLFIPLVIALLGVYLIQIL